MRLATLLFTILLLRVTFCYTNYSSQQTNQIKHRQQEQWRQLSYAFSPNQHISFILERRLNFFIRSGALPGKIKMRAKAYFVQHHRKFKPIDQFTPFDVTKIYVYSPNGLIIKAQQFYEKFAFQVHLKQNELYHIVFVDGPPGPPKLIEWQIQSAIPQNFQPESIATESQLDILSARMRQIEQFVAQSAQQVARSVVMESHINNNFIRDNQYYSFYIYGESVFVVVVAVLQIYAIRSTLRTDTISIL